MVPSRTDVNFDPKRGYDYDFDIALLDFRRAAGLNGDDIDALIDFFE